jgi:hypothetical protein
MIKKYHKLRSRLLKDEIYWLNHKYSESHGVNLELFMENTRLQRLLDKQPQPQAAPPQPPQ